MLNSFFEYLNYHPIWHRSISLWNNRYRAPSADRLLALYLHQVGLMGKTEQAIFTRFIQPGMKVADIGANQGLFTLLFSQRVGEKGSVVAFEPEPRLFQSLKENCKSNSTKNVQLFNLALGRESGKVVLYRSVFNSGDNRLNPSFKIKSGVEVKVEPLDSLLGDSHFDFIKIDVQGHELDVFQGMRKITRSSPNLKIYFEYWPGGLRKAGSNATEVLDLLGQAGFHLYYAKLEGLELISDFKVFAGQIRDSQYINILASRTLL